MSEYVKKGTLGYKAVQDGCSDPEWTHVIMSREEYFDFMDKISSAERAAVKADADAVENIEKIETYYDEKYLELETEYQEIYKKNQEEFLEIKAESKRNFDEAKRQESLNMNLKRIAKERANQKRGIKPKKEHDGYLVLRSQQYNEKWTEEKDFDKWKKENPRANNKDFIKIIHHSAEVWKSVIQTPYDASIPLKVIEKTIMDELWNDGSGILSEIGCMGILKKEYNGNYHTFIDQDTNREQNGLYKWTFSANFRSGFWEVIIYTTQSLLIPEGRRPI